MHQLAGAVAALPENSLHWHQERLTCQIVLADAAPEAVAENSHIVERAAQCSDDRTAEHVAEAARSLAASEARGRELLQNTAAADPEAAGRLAGGSAAGSSLADVPVLRAAAVADQGSDARMFEHWPATAGPEAVGWVVDSLAAAGQSLAAYAAG